MSVWPRPLARARRNRQPGDGMFKNVYKVISYDNQKHLQLKMSEDLQKSNSDEARAWAHGSRAVGVLLMALAAWSAWLARDLPLMQRDTVGPVAFPVLMAAGLGLAGLVIARRRFSLPWSIKGLSAHSVPLAGMLLFPLTLPWLGTLMALALGGTVMAHSTSGSWRRACLIGPGLAALLHGVVVWGLGTPLPWWLP